MVALYSYRDDPNVPEFDDSAPIAVMDAHCALCSWGARMIHRLDKTGTVRICPVQSPLGAALIQHYGLDANDPESWLFIDRGWHFEDFEAVLHAASRFGGWANIVALLRVIPKPLRAWLYRRMARNRFAMFGRGDFCALPDPGFQKRLLQ